MSKHVRIFQPAKTAMQSGRAKTKGWVMVFEPSDATRPDPIIGWNGSADTSRQVRLTFDSKEDAIEHARKNGFTYTCLLGGEVVAPEYKALALPTFYVIGPDGKVLYASVGFEPNLDVTIGTLIEGELAGQSG